MTHRRYRDRATAAEKDRMSAMFDSPIWCDKCRCNRPRIGGRYVPIGNGRQEFHCAAHGVSRG